MNGDVVERIDADLAELVDRFLECSRRDQEELERALELGDMETARRIGHSAKGAGAAYGFLGLRDLGRELETAAGRGETESVRALALRLRGYLENVRVEYA
ncbi:Hpt domain-containing protein [Desulfovibrio aminophilus]|nr:Hpt domain-containing protein [Desulfovibrio aminophilus]MCM0756408.1 Hpt domain-containing protein [Desulfovibrio aminophilus]